MVRAIPITSPFCLGAFVYVISVVGDCNLPLDQHLCDYTTGPNSVRIPDNADTA